MQRYWVKIMKNDKSKTSYCSMSQRSTNFIVMSAPNILRKKQNTAKKSNIHTHRHTQAHQSTQKHADTWSNIQQLIILLATVVRRLHQDDSKIGSQTDINHD